MNFKKLGTEKMSKFFKIHFGLHFFYTNLFGDSSTSTVLDKILVYGLAIKRAFTEAFTGLANQKLNFKNSLGFIG